MPCCSGVYDLIIWSICGWGTIDVVVVAATYEVRSINRPGPSFLNQMFTFLAAAHDVGTGCCGLVSMGRIGTGCTRVGIADGIAMCPTVVSIIFEFSVVVSTWIFLSLLVLDEREKSVQLCLHG